MSGKAGLEEEKDRDIEMEEAEIPKIRRFALDKLLDEFKETYKDLKALFAFKLLLFSFKFTSVLSHFYSIILIIRLISELTLRSLSPNAVSYINLTAPFP